MVMISSFTTATTRSTTTDPLALPVHGVCEKNTDHCNDGNYLILHGSAPCFYLSPFPVAFWR